MRFYNQSKDIFLSECLGYPVYNYLFPICTNIEERSMYQIKINTFNSNLNKKNKFLLNKGFKHICTNVQFELTSTMDITIEREDNSNCFEVAQKHTDEILKIASTSFAINRYYSDSNITKNQADFIMERWAYNCLYQGRGDHVFLKFDYQSDKVIGFLFARVEDDKAIIDLLAIDNEYKAKRHGYQLVEQFFLKYAWQSDKIKKLQVCTQITNIAAIKTYQNMGFKIAGFDYVYHLHTGV